MDDADLFRDAISAFIAARNAGCPLHDCVAAVLDVAERGVDGRSGPGMEIVSFVDAKPGERGPEIGLKGPENQAWTLETVALTPAIFVAAHARGLHQWMRHSDCDHHLEVVDITADVGPGFGRTANRQ